MSIEKQKNLSGFQKFLDFAFKLDDEFRAEFKEHWRVLVAAVVVMFFAFAAPAFATPFLIKSVIQEFGWTREQAMLVISFKYLTGAVFSILVGYLIDRVGVRKMLVALSALGGFALLSFLMTSNLPTYYFGGVLLGMATPGTIVAVKVLVSRTYLNCQGTAMGISLVGVGLGGMFVSAIIPHVFGALEWRLGMAVLSLGIWLVALPMLLFFLPKNTFDRVDSVRAVSARKEGVPVAMGPPAAKIKESDAAVSLLLRDHRFWLIGFVVAVAGLVDQAFIQHLVIYFEIDLGMQPTTVGYFVSGYFLIGLLCRPMIGNFFDAQSTKGVASLYAVLSVSCLLALAVTNPIIMFFFIVFRAVGHAAVLMDTVILAKHVFGNRGLGFLLGVYTAFVNLGFATGPWLLARIYDATGSYQFGFILFSALAALAAICLWFFLKPEYWMKVRDEKVSASVSSAAV
ncbi:MAG: MFS transporter [Henriciella sp.]